MPEAQAVRKKWDSRSFYFDAIKGLLVQHGGVFPDVIERRHYFSNKAIIRTLGFAETHQNVQGPAGFCTACGKRVRVSRLSSLSHGQGSAFQTRNMCVYCGLKLHARQCHALYHVELLKNIEGGRPDAPIVISQAQRTAYAEKLRQLKAAGKAIRVRKANNPSGRNGVTAKKEKAAATKKAAKKDGAVARAELTKELKQVAHFGPAGEEEAAENPAEDPAEDGGGGDPVEVEVDDREEVGDGEQDSGSDSGSNHGGFGADADEEGGSGTTSGFNMAGFGGSGAADESGDDYQPQGQGQNDGGFPENAGGHVNDCNAQ